MARWPTTLAALVMIWSPWHGFSLICDVVELFQLINGPQLYIQQHAPTPVAARLGSCSSWCEAVESCRAFTWHPGQCAQVGPTGAGNVTKTVFIVKKNITLPGEWLSYSKYRTIKTMTTDRIDIDFVIFFINISHGTRRYQMRISTNLRRMMMLWSLLWQIVNVVNFQYRLFSKGNARISS